MRAALIPFVEPQPIGEVEGDGEHVVVEVDERPVATWLAASVGRDVRRLVTSDHLGAVQMHHRAFESHRDVLAQRLGREASVVVTDGRVARVLRSAGIAFRWLHQVVTLPTDPIVGSCASPGERPMACCGGAEPLRSHHPEDARRVGERFGQRAVTSTYADGACASHLRECGLQVVDVVEVLRQEVGA
ncbi:MAG: hypothetical protein KTR31_13710 [Myxococcales bacterium]|nr:hypothetical protein [Myxococcales bacterium]